MEFVFCSQLYLIYMLLNDLGYLLEEFNWLFKEKTHIKIMYGCFIVLIFLPYPWPTHTCLHNFCTGCQVDNIVYGFQHKISSKMVYSNLGTKGVQQNLFWGFHLTDWFTSKFKSFPLTSMQNKAFLRVLLKRP